MKKPLLLTCMTLLLPALTGCLVVDIGWRKNSNPIPATPATDVVIVPASTTDRATMAEIDAAAALSLDAHRVEALSKIAKRKDLGAASQVHLVNTVFQKVRMEPHKVSLLQDLIGNPAFSNPAKQQLLSRLRTLGLENHKTALLASINERGELAQ